MYDVVVTWHDCHDEPVCAVMYRGDFAPSENALLELSSKIPVPFVTVVVSLTLPNSLELVSLDVYEVGHNGNQN